MLDLESATRAMARVVRGVRDNDLPRSTPCAGSGVAALLDHLGKVVPGLTKAARKKPSTGTGQPLVSQPPVGVADELPPDWRVRLPEALDELAEAWGEAAAWTGVTRIAGMELPSETAGLVALNEVVVHTWDLARATGQPFHVEDAVLVALEPYQRKRAARYPDGAPGFYLPPLPISSRAPLLDQVLALTGRDPRWQPPAAVPSSSSSAE
jgi:uncharacterized protein (TIGR03086 family)